MLSHNKPKRKPQKKLNLKKNPIPKKKQNKIKVQQASVSIFQDVCWNETKEIRAYFKESVKGSEKKDTFKLIFEVLNQE